MSGHNVSEALRALRRKTGLYRRILRFILIALPALIILTVGLYFVTLPRFRAAGPLERGPYAHTGKIAGLTVRDNGSFFVSMENGFQWDSNPSEEVIENDSRAKGVQKMAMYSQMAIKYADTSNRVSPATTYANATIRDTVKPDIRRDGGKYIVTYRFITGKESEGKTIDIPLIYELVSGALRVSVDTANIRENDTFVLLEVSLLPFFGSAQAEDDGYILVPDGGGGLIDFTEANRASAAYSAFVYGRDPILKTQKVVRSEEPVRLPVLGMKRADNAWLAVAESGDANATVNAQPAGLNTDRYNAYFTFTYREMDDVQLNEMSWDQRSIPVVARRHAGVDAFTVTYYFLEGDQADYAGMASVNRSLLESAYGSSSTETGGVPLYLDVYMSVEKTRAVLGLPMNAQEPLTTFSQLEDMLEAFSREGVERLEVKLTGWSGDAPYTVLPSSVSGASALGGTGGMKKLIAAADGMNATLYPSVNMTVAYRSGNGFTPFLQGARDINGALAQQNKYLLSTGTKDLLTSTWNLVNPGFAAASLERFMSRLSRKLPGTAVALDGYGDTLYSDPYSSLLDGASSRTPATRGGAQAMWQQGIDGAGELFGEVMVSGGNAYALGAGHIVNIPMDTSGFNIVTRDVPYYQMVLSGFRAAASTPVNFRQDPEAYTLRCLEGGTYPLYAFTHGDSYLIKETALQYLYNTEYTQWFGQVTALYAKYRDAYEAVGGRRIVGHSREDDVSVTRFEGGAVLTIDHAAGRVTLEGGGGQ